MKRMNFQWLYAIGLLAMFLAVSFACGDDDDDNDAAVDDDAAIDDDVADDDAVTDDDYIDDDQNDDDTGDDDTNDDDDNVFPPEEQTPLWQKGFILPPDSLECYPVGGEPTMYCNHHGSTVAVLPDGTIAAVWYHGEAEKSPDSRIVWSFLEPGDDEWTWPEVLYDDPDRAEGNPTLWVDEDDTYYLFFVSIYGDGWSQAKIRLIRSYDEGASWTDPVMLRNQYCWMTRHRPVRMDNGELLLPLYNECLAYPVFMRSADNFASWTEEAQFSLSYYLEHVGQIQPALAVLDDGRVTAMTRDGFITHRVKQMVSEDDGLTWTPSRSTVLPNSGTSIDQVRLLDGHVVVVYNDSPDSRFPLTVALSHDGGETFVAKRNINDECESGDCSYAYPSIAQSPVDGTIWVTYSFERQTIGWVQFNEAWLLEGEAP